MRIIILERWRYNSVIVEENDFLFVGRSKNGLEVDYRDERVFNHEVPENCITEVREIVDAPL